MTEAGGQIIAQAQAWEDNALTILGGLEGTGVTDEVQEPPSIFPVLRVLADREPTVTRFVISGSVSPRVLLHGRRQENFKNSEPNCPPSGETR